MRGRPGVSEVATGRNLKTRSRDPAIILVALDPSALKSAAQRNNNKSELNPTASPTAMMATTGVRSVVCSFLACR